MLIDLRKDIFGSILDIGGGGEGIIGRAFGKRVIAIDNRQEELDEAPDCCEKRVMDATVLEFEDAAFENVTFFYSLMYMDPETQQKAIREASRVLKTGGSVHIWDADISSAYPEPFVVHLEIPIGDETVCTSYGIVKPGSQQADEIIRYAQQSRLRIMDRQETDGQFYLRFSKA